MMSKKKKKTNQKLLIPDLMICTNNLNRIRFVPSGTEGKLERI